MGPLSVLCNHLWLGEVAGCVPWQDGATGWTELGSSVCPDQVGPLAILLPDGVADWTVC